MCPLIVPYRFVAGTYAKAEEVNDNFAQTKLFCDTLETQIAQHDVSIMQMENNKANVNGNTGEIFRVADAVNDFDAVNKQYFMNGIWNTLEVIRGLELTKANNTTITIGEGGCYDSLLEYLMKNNSSINVELESPADNTVYYVYLVGNDVGDVTGVFSTNSGSPSLPVGYTLYRKLGYVVTDDEGNIDSINTNDDTIENGIGIYPNYGIRYYRSAGTTYTESTNGLLFMRIWRAEGQQWGEIVISGVSYNLSANLTNREGGQFEIVTFPIAKGMSYVFRGTGSVPIITWEVYFIPVK